jgi:queuine tRNA-ribosyltransferase
MAKEMLGPILLTHHNLTFYQLLMSEARRQLAAGTFASWLEQQRLALGENSEHH